MPDTLAKGVGQRRGGGEQSIGVPLPIVYRQTEGGNTAGIFPIIGFGMFSKGTGDSFGDVAMGIPIFVCSIYARPARP